MTQQTPLGSHPDIKKPQIPNSMQLLKVVILLLICFLILWQIYSINTVSNFSWGLIALGAFLVVFIDTIYEWQNKYYRVWNLFYLTTLVILGSYFALKP